MSSLYLQQTNHDTQLMQKHWRQVLFNPFLFILNGDSETFLQQRQFADQVSDGVCKGFLLKHHNSYKSHKRAQCSSNGPCLHLSSYLWTVVRCRLDSDDDLVFQRMRNFVPSKENLRILQQLTCTDTMRLQCIDCSFVV